MTRLIVDTNLRYTLCAHVDQIRLHHYHHHRHSLTYRPTHCNNNLTRCRRTCGVDATEITNNARRDSAQNHQPDTEGDYYVRK